MKLTLKAQLSIIALIAILSLTILISLSFSVLSKVTFGSDMHKSMMASNNFVAELAPPSLFLIEANMNALQLANLSSDKVSSKVQEIKKNIHDFKEKEKKYGENKDLTSEQRKYVSDNLSYHADALIKYLENTIIPLAESGNGEKLRAAYPSLFDLYQDHKKDVVEGVELTNKHLDSINNSGASTVSFFKGMIITIGIISLLLVVACCVFFSRNILRSLGADPVELQGVASAISNGNFNVTLPVVENANSLLGAMSEMLASIKKGAAEALDNSRIKQALNATSSNVMLADVGRNIVYMNKAVENMLREAEPDLRKVLPHFAVDKIIGSNMDIFHRNPSHQSNLLANLRDTYVANIVVAGRSFRLLANPIFSESGERLGSVVEWIDRTKEVAAEHELARILGAIETTTTNVMIADNDRKIIYMNKSVESMLRAAESDLRKALPNFSVDKILGSNIDVFHKNPAHQIKLLENLTTTYTTNIVVSGRSFRLVANPIFSKDGSRIGSVVEWLDRTLEVQVEGEVSDVVKAASAGNFKARIDTQGKTGFFLSLAEGLNALMQTSDIGLGEVNRVLGALAKGDLTERITADYSGTFGELKNYCNQTTESLTGMMSDIRNAAETIFTASSEIAQGNADLSSRTEQQAANLEETASSMEELTSTVKLNADNAKQANVLAEQASTVASHGGMLIQEVVTTMTAINDASQKIADIIGVIDGIAFQTNILALNAAVEAARAGDQGRGFAVVASEVRTLAQRSANAAKDIKALISDSVKKIESGNALVGKSGDTMKEIVVAIKRVNDIMAEIAAASSEQSAGIEEVSTAVSQMDEMTQQNAALVEEAAAAAESLQSQADTLTQNVLRFRLSNDAATMSHAHGAPKSKPASSAAKKSSGAVATKKLTPPKQQDDEWESF